MPRKYSIHLCHIIVLLVSTAVLIFSCRKDETKKPVDGGILVPLTENAEQSTDAKDADKSQDNDLMLPLVSPGDDFRILTSYNGNLDLQPADEQVLLVVPLKDDTLQTELIIATTNAIQNEYAIVWRKPLESRIISGYNLRIEDFTGNGREDIAVLGFDITGNHITEIFAVKKNSRLENFTNVFSINIDGNTDLVPPDNMDKTLGNLNTGNPYQIVVQRNDPDSDNELDIIEDLWIWNSGRFRFLQKSSLQVKAKTIHEGRLQKLYSSNVQEYENYLDGIWYREDGDRAYQDMMYFSPNSREISFYNGTILELFNWGKSHRTTAKRLYFKITNSIVPSITDSVRVNVDSWDSLDMSSASKDWNGKYRRLSTSYQKALEDELSMSSLLSNETFAGTWKSTGNQELVFDFPRIQWTSGAQTRSGRYSIINLQNVMVLQVEFLKENGASDTTENWIVKYEEDKDTSRILRFLTLQPAVLSAYGVRFAGDDFIRFEQIEIISQTDQ